MPRTVDPQLNERRRRQILEAATRCVIRRGFHQTSMQEICAEAEMSSGGLYRYFDSKEAIIAAIAEDERAENAAIRAGPARTAVRTAQPCCHDRSPATRLSLSHLQGALWVDRHLLCCFTLSFFHMSARLSHSLCGHTLSLVCDTWTTLGGPPTLRLRWCDTVVRV